MTSITNGSYKTDYYCVYASDVPDGSRLTSIIAFGLSPENAEENALKHLNSEHEGHFLNTKKCSKNVFDFVTGGKYEDEDCDNPNIFRFTQNMENIELNPIIRTKKKKSLKYLKDSVRRMF